GAPVLTAHFVEIPPDGIVYVSDLPFLSAVNGWGPVQRDTSNGESGASDGRPITLNGVVYPKGLGMHSPAELKVDLAGRYSTFATDVGLDAEIYRGWVVFEVWVDGALTWASPIMTGSSATESVALDVGGASELRLVVTNADGSVQGDHADWAGARLVVAPPSTSTTTTTTSTTTTTVPAEACGNCLDDDGDGRVDFDDADCCG